MSVDDVLPRMLDAFDLTDDTPSAVVLDLDAIDRRFDTLRSAFPVGWLHAAAMKALPLPAVLRRIVDAEGGLEAASVAEVEVARRTGCPADRIVFDSPAKTTAELADALAAGVTINADNLSEVVRIAEICDGRPRSAVGLRINPEVGAGTIEALSVATRNGKFGVSLEAEADAAAAAFQRHDWLDGVHVHVGSQGCGLELLTAGIRRAVEFADEVGARRIDIGGGLPFDYRGDGGVPSVDDYAARLRSETPRLFGDEFEVTTEFGRWLFAPTGWAVSRVEYVKPAADVDIATIHFGADLMLRHIYQPGTWHHPIRVFDPEGRERNGPTRRVTLAGPLCFSGDVLASDVELPRLRPGDIVTVGNVGAYTLSMWSHYCSRRFPTVLGVSSSGVQTLRTGDSVADAARFWEPTP